jgi:hypothetical protein
MPSAIAFFQLLIGHLQANAKQLGDGVQLQAFTERQATEFLQSP